MRYILVLLLLFSSLLADRDGGPYLGFGYGVSIIDNDGYSDEMKEDNSDAISLYGGAYINNNFSVEAAYTSFNSFGLSDGYLLDETKVITISAFSVSTLVHYQFFDDIVDVYGKFGVGEVGVSGFNENGFMMMYGAGMGIRFTEMFSLKVAYDRFNFNYLHTMEDDSTQEYNMNVKYFYTALEVQF